MAWSSGRLASLILVVGGGALLVSAAACEPVDYLGDDYATPRLPKRQRIDDAEDAGARTEPAIDAGASRTANCTDGGCGAPTDAGLLPATQTFTVASGDCGGGRCGGGYDDEKQASQMPTATKLCIDRGYPKATDFTIGGQPGGRFCSYNGTAFGCDDDCDGCNVMATVTCAR